MRAWRFYEFNDMRLDEVPDPVPGPGEVLLKVRVVEPSVTEAIVFSGVETEGSERVRKRMRGGPAQMFGHEYSAEVVALGDGVERLRVGDRVADRALLPCMECELCRSGRDDDCRRGPVTGSDFPGCLAELAAIPQNALVPVRHDHVSDYEIAAMQPAAECVAAIASAEVECGDTVVVIGQGAMGIYATQAARHTLASRVIAVDVRAEPLEMAKRFGADDIVNGAETDPVEAVLELTAGAGADIVIESAGGPPKEGLAGSATVDQAMAMVRDTGKVVISSIVPGLVPIDFQRARLRSTKLIFPEMAHLRHLAATVEMVASGRLQIEPLVSHVVWGLEQAPLAFEITADKGRYGATGPAQIVVDTAAVPRHERTVDPASTG
jgi:threonine dehydrogenase-like Zn-dependent dehydrogenase